jgi:glyoxylase-like metal-dependent hydrolase (beta-lactamase superfamily II)
MKQIIENVYQITFAGFLNAFLIDNGSELILIDTGLSSKSIKKISSELSTIGKSLKDVKHILITHGHPDHVGGLIALQNQITAKTYAHHQEAPIIRGEKPMPAAKRSDLRGLSWLMSFVVKSAMNKPAQVDVEVNDGTELDDILPGLQVVGLIGHTYGHVGYWWEKHNILFAGDVMIRLPWGLRMPFAAVTPDWEMAKEAVHKVAAMNVDTLCLSHGSPIIGKASEKINAFAGKV